MEIIGEIKMILNTDRQRVDQGGYGSGGATITDAGVIYANNNLAVDGTSTWTYSVSIREAIAEIGSTDVSFTNAGIISANRKDGG